ncbi:ATP phosphoribosyltransferase [Anabaena sp. FACHB-1237]|uniref:ATP phosphoribosyltransferase n=1 Tax=Anabaena sp. FACHB-1237 TaxID=2692769 RepID=UPI0016812A1B|nr:ATP phosphoribosyltransferase [Anabaena sp. FACHB-1237]MBD2138472.1 ATP phosphoribosyltransferase [Anabaena sp. FACHB-1237]
MLTVALPKGELLKNSIQLLKSVGLDFSAFLEAGNRQLQIVDGSGQAKGLLVRAQDVPVYVEYGQAQLGIVGYDVLKEKQPQVAQLIDLKYGYCRMSVAVKANSIYKSPLDLPAHGRVASKYVNCAREYFQDLDLPVEIVPLYGSVELGPITGMSEAIVDLVSTGKTLRENGLIEIAVLYESTARLIVHPLSYRLNMGNIYQLVETMRNQLLTRI